MYLFSLKVKLPGCVKKCLLQHSYYTMLSPESRLPSWIMISIIGLQYWRISLIHDNLQHGLRLQLRILCLFWVMLHLFLLNYDLTLYVLRQCLYKKHNKELDLYHNVLYPSPLNLREVKVPTIDILPTLNNVCNTQWPFYSFMIKNGYCMVNWS
jgi:hypothetical protein